MFEKKSSSFCVDAFDPKISYEKSPFTNGIFFKVDWVTCMFSDSTLNDVLRWIKLEGCVSEFLKDMYEYSRGYTDEVRFLYNGILLTTNKFGYYGDSPEEVFDVVVPKVRLELTGSGLDFLRSMGVDFTSYRFVRPELREGASYHFTRIDFAFDFVNYKAEFMDKLIEHCQTHQLPSGRIPLASTHGAIGWDLRLGDRKCVYLGSCQSDRYLRCYDKRLQMINRVTDTYVRANPYNNPDSWFRIEWQLRNKKAHDAALDSDQTSKTLLKNIFDAYSMADGKRDSHTLKRAVVNFWLDLFPWREVESLIIQNANFVAVKDPDVRVISSFESTMMRTFIFYASLLGREEFVRRVNEYLKSMYEFNDLSARRRQGFNLRLNELSIAKLNLIPDFPSFGLYREKGVFKFGF